MEEESLQVKLDSKIWEKLCDLILSLQDVAAFKNDELTLSIVNQLINVTELVDSANELKYKVEDAATYLGVSTKTILRMIHDGRLKANKIGKFYYIAEKNLQKIKVPEPQNDKIISIKTLKMLGIVKGED